MANNDILDKARGCLVCGAVGDALGYPVEFIGSYRQIAAKYGEGGISELERSPYWTDPDDGTTLISDDTQMTLYTAEGLLRSARLGIPPIQAIKEAYLQWYGQQAGVRIANGYPSELAAIPALNQNRAPGTTCMSALRAIHSGHEPANDSKGCGGIMRIAPVAIYGAAHGWTLEQTARLAGEAAAITHQHPTSTLSSACAAALIQLCLLHNGNGSAFDLMDAATKALDCTESLYHHSSDMMDLRLSLIVGMPLEGIERPEWMQIEDTLGGGWVADETLSIALYSVASHPDSVKGCLRCAVNHGGDSDSTGAVAGNIIGAILGYQAIPQEYLAQVQMRSLLEDYAERLVK